MSTISRYWKAVVGFVAPGAVIIGSSVLEGSDGGTRITTAEWVTAGVACIITAAGVAAAKNAPAPAEPLKPATHPESPYPPEGV